MDTEKTVSASIYIQRILKGSKLEWGPVIEQIKRTPWTSIWHAHFHNIRRCRVSLTLQTLQFA